MDEQGEQAAMAKKKRHSRAEIATKLVEANDLAKRGKLQSEIARTLGVSVMTLHRWRKASHGPQAAHGIGEPNGARGRGNRIAELQLENSRLRRLVTDLLLEKIRFEEAAQKQKFDRVSFPKIPSGLDSHRQAESSPVRFSRSSNCAATGGAVATRAGKVLRIR